MLYAQQIFMCRMNPRLASAQVTLPRKHRHTIDIPYTLFPWHSPPVVGATVGGDLGMGLLLHEMYISGKR